MQIFAGSSIGNDKSGSDTGTLGCFAQLRSDSNAKVLLSANHVIFSSTSGSSVKIGSPSAGSCRCCCAKNVVAEATARGKEENVAFNGQQVYVDCAIARLTSGTTGVNRITGRGFLAGTRAAVLNERVFVASKEGLISGKVANPAQDVPVGPGGPVEKNQILIEVDPGQEKTIVDGSGDSGAVVVNEHNEIVGLMHSRTSSTPGGDPTELTKFIIASPIGAVMEALQIDIPSAVPASPSHGEALLAVPEEPAGPVLAPQITDPELLRFQRLVRSSELGGVLHDSGFRHGSEVVHLVHHCRPVTVAWHRGQGPAWAAHLINSARDPEYRMPEDVKGVTQEMLLRRMAEALAKHGSDALRADLETHGPAALSLLSGVAGVPDLLDRLGVPRASWEGGLS